MKSHTTAVLEVLQKANTEAIAGHTEAAFKEQIVVLDAFHERYVAQVRAIATKLARAGVASTPTLSLCGASTGEWRTRLRAWCDELSASDDEDAEGARGLAAFLEEVGDSDLWNLLHAYLCSPPASLRTAARRPGR